MIIYKDLLTNKEVGSDAYSTRCEDDDFMLIIKGKMITRKVGGGISADLIGGNPSQEDSEDQPADEEQQSESGIDLVLSFNLVDRSDYFTSKKDLQGYLKKWAKNAAAHLEQEDKEKCDRFKKGCGKYLKKFTDLWNDDNVTVYTDEDFDPADCKSGVLLGIWDEDGMGITMHCIKDGLVEEKC